LVFIKSKFLKREETTRMIKVFIVALTFVIILAVPVFAGERVLTSEGFDRYNPVYLKADGKGNLWTAFYDLKNRIHIKNITKDRDLIVNEQAKPGASNGLAFHIQGEHVFAVWREEEAGVRRLYLRATHDGGETLSDPVLIDTRTRSFTRIKIGSNEKGEVLILWYGEKGIEYNFYTVCSSDFGKTFSEPQNLTTGYRESIYPTLLVDEKGAHIFSYSIRGKDEYMITRKTTDGGITWTEPLEIKKIGTVTVFIEPIRVGNRLHVFWYNGYKDFYVIESAYSDDEGKTWKTRTHNDTKGLEIESMKVNSDPAGNIYLSLSAIRDMNEKFKVYIIKSADNGETWGKLTPLRHYPFNNTHAQSPSLFAADGGEVVAAWVDYRNIRSNLYMQYSKDYGNTWLEKDVPLEEPGRFNTSLYPYTNSILKAGDRYYLLAQRFRSDFISQAADLLLLDFRLEEVK
jgi:hypothetical protein